MNEVRNHLDSLLIDTEKKKEWDNDEIEDSVIPRIKDRGDRVASSLLDDRNLASSPEINENVGGSKINENATVDENHKAEEDEELSLDLDEPSPEVMEYARRELGETDEVKCQTLQELREMIYGNY